MDIEQEKEIVEKVNTILYKNGVRSNYPEKLVEELVTLVDNALFNQFIALKEDANRTRNRINER